MVGGFCPRQTSMALGQRGWKRQPAGGAMRLGTVPGMVASSPACSTLGTERSSPWV